MDKPTSRVGGDFSFEVMEQFRAAYAQQLQNPDNDEVANNSGLPTNTIPNTSPWIEHTGIWKYPSGKGPDEDLKTAFDPNAFLSNEVIDGDGQIDELSDEDVEAILNEVTQETEEEEEDDG